MSNRSKETEFKCYGLYSSVAKDLDCTSADVDIVYSWYLDQVIKTTTEEEVLQVMLRGLGTIKINLKKGISFLQGYTISLQKITGYYQEHPEKKTEVKAKALNARCLQLLATADSLKARVSKMKDLDLINETGYINKTTIIDKIKNQLDNLYESIQRIPGPEYQGSEKRRQSPEWTEDQSNRPI